MTTLGSGVDGAVQRLEAAFNGRGLPETLSSYDKATVGSGSVVNQVELVYSGFDQVTGDYQSHSVVS